jgi:hypothetical protein
MQAMKRAGADLATGQGDSRPSPAMRSPAISPTDSTAAHPGGPLPPPGDTTAFDGYGMALAAVAQVTITCPDRGYQAVIERRGRLAARQTRKRRAILRIVGNPDYAGQAGCEPHVYALPRLARTIASAAPGTFRGLRGGRSVRAEFHPSVGVATATWDLSAGVRRWHQGADHGLRRAGRPQSRWGRPAGGDAGTAVRSRRVLTPRSSPMRLRLVTAPPLRDDGSGTGGCPWAAWRQAVAGLVRTR